MADAQRALIWVLERSAQLGLEITAREWIGSVFKGWTDTSCSLNWEGRRLTAWGADSDPDRSLLKSFAESLERIALFTSDQTNSNGFAAHLNREGADRNARNEVVERDLFFCHFLTDSPFPPLPAEDKAGDWVKTARAWVSGHGARLRFFRLGATGALCVIDGLEAPRPYGLLLGLSAQEDPADSIRSAFIEAGRAAHLQFSAPDSPSLTLEQYRELKDPTFSDHGRLALNPDYARRIDQALLSPGSGTPPSSARELARERIRTDEIRIPRPVFEDCPFVIARASSPEAQGLFRGPTTIEKVNLERLRRFSGRDLRFEDLCPLPHPLD